MNKSKNKNGIYDIPKEQLKKINGGLHPAIWLLIGIAVGGIGDFHQDREDAKGSY
jgi:hypothetical protein